MFTYAHVHVRTCSRTQTLRTWILKSYAEILLRRASRCQRVPYRVFLIVDYPTFHRCTVLSNSLLAFVTLSQLYDGLGQGERHGMYIVASRMALNRRTISIFTCAKLRWPRSADGARKSITLSWCR